MIEQAIFWVLAVISITSGIGMIANKNPVRSALFLVANFLVLALFYLTLSAQFIAAVQVIVYAGAIMVLFLFVIMLLNMGSPNALNESGGLQKPVAAILAVMFIAILGGAGALGTGLGPVGATKATIETGGTVETIGKNLFDPGQPWLFPFEVTSILLLVGIVGAVTLAKKKL
jgi:NADH-quinone oxidoreductase subunit J